ncbi:hypothetical protein HYU40_01510 [Candidatus Woesearchaeota archaeon]|nr:hypothetical protein [Candidatus Woesearchaeota archaeon]
MKSEVYFGDEHLKETYLKLQNSKTEEKALFRWISKAIGDLEQNAFCGTQVPKRLIPKIYVDKYKVDNLWKYDLPNGWRLLYSIAREEIVILSIILEWFNHKEYERRFRY